MRKGLKQLLRPTIWDSDAIHPLEGQLACDVKRWMLPVFDAILIATSILAVRGGMPTFEIVYNSTVSQVAAWVFLVASITCLIGISIPKLWLLETAGKLVLLAVLLGYGFVLMLSSFEDPDRGFVGGVTLAACLVPIWRIVWLGREWRRRKDN